MQRQQLLRGKKKHCHNPVSRTHFPLFSPLCPFYPLVCFGEWMKSGCGHIQEGVKAQPWIPAASSVLHLSALWSTQLFPSCPKYFLLLLLLRFYLCTYQILLLFLCIDVHLLFTLKHAFYKKCRCPWQVDSCMLHMWTQKSGQVSKNIIRKPFMNHGTGRFLA